MGDMNRYRNMVNTSNLKKVKNIIKKIDNKIVVKRQINRLYKEFDKLNTLPRPCGKYQYIYSSNKGEISLVRLADYIIESIDFWEIYCLKGDLFDDVERFKSKKEAERRIFELLK